MNRPPRPQIKSSKSIIGSTQRKSTTPDALLQQLQQCMRDGLRSMRDTNNSIPNGLHRSVNQVENIQYLQISRNNHLSSINVSYEGHNNIAIGRSFKIRNFGTMKSKLKQNTIPLKIKCKPILGPTAFLPSKTTETTAIQFLKLKAYPQNLHLQYIGSKVGHHFIHENFSPSKYSNWCFIISQSIFYGSIISETNLLKLRFLVQHLTKQYYGVIIILMLHSQLHAAYIGNTLKQREIKITGVIWSKQKYVETINSFDLSQICNEFNTNRYVIIQDNREIIKSIYFQHSQQCQNCTQETNKQKLNPPLRDIDFSCKYLYIKLQGLANFVRFCQKLKIFQSADEICVQKIQFKDETDQIILLEQLIQKIRLFSFNRAYKLNKSRQQHKSKQLNSSNAKKPEQTYGDLKQKLIQYGKILQKELKKQKKQKKQNAELQKCCSKSVNKKGQSLSITNGSKGTKVSQDLVVDQSGKSLTQIIQELVKNNTLINKQINKFREKAEKDTFGVKF